MSRSHQETIDCSHCREQQAFTIWESLNVSANPNLKQSLLNGDLTTFRCRCCGHEAHVAYDCLYHDMNHSLAIWLKYSDPDRSSDIDPAAKAMFSAFVGNYTRRLVASFHELLDKIRVFDDGFSDHTIELLKVLICIREGIDLCTPFHYAAVEAPSFRRKSIVFVLETKQGFVERRYPMHQYLNAIEPLTPKIGPLINKISDKWPHVNRTFMLRTLEASGLMRAIRSNNTQ